MSNINTSGINSTYPTPGVNNSTQGFRDNFTSIKNNLNTAYEEITDLQNKVIVKAALNNIALDNDMANTLISNAAVKSFRQPTYNLGAAIPSSIPILISKGDIQYGTIIQDTTFEFKEWAPTGTKNSVELHLTIANNAAMLKFPDSVYNASNVVIQGCNPGIYNVQNFVGAYANGDPFAWNPTRNLANLTIQNSIGVPAGVTELQIKISSVDCGSTIDIEPLNVSQIADKGRVRSPSSFGTQGDYPGSFTFDSGALYVCTAPYGSIASLVTETTSGGGGECIIGFAEQPIAPFKVGATVTVENVDPPEYNGTYTVTECTTSSVKFDGVATGTLVSAGTVTGQRVIWGKVPLTAV